MDIVTDAVYNSK